MEQQPEKNSRKSFINFVLKRFNSNKEKRQAKYTKSDLHMALDNINRKRFKIFLTYEMPKYILSSNKIQNREDYFQELNFMLSCAEQQQNGQEYYKGCFKAQKNKPERHYLQIVAKRLSRLSYFDELNVRKKYYGKKQYVELIKHIMQKSNKTDREAKQILINFLDSEEINDNQKEHVKNEILKLNIQ
ncbi:unnamed protein product (macronuclear) [Paramecium tetraurelia]|uniref:Uncharacterized protein n=1 Tax=Paramecium tetraurelia TaxID=5888 RepID=A0BTJ2_PARTE|nr:uncharacterized protein GSPATT00032091001 [Paramecium tetraurelia]CAK61859.1 unnamed protein product [Paramecium tetraurelia]|eukprot:XP_001429257.1 hypothetical protein (macronuclear) [Paramecium tetraurelia strain d4-2]